MPQWQTHTHLITEITTHTALLRHADGELRNVEVQMLPGSRARADGKVRWTVGSRRRWHTQIWANDLQEAKCLAVTLSRDAMPNGMPVLTSTIPPQRPWPYWPEADQPLKQLSQA